MSSTRPVLSIALATVPEPATYIAILGTLPFTVAACRRRSDWFVRCERANRRISPSSGFGDRRWVDDSKSGRGPPTSNNTAYDCSAGYASAC